MIFIYQVGRYKKDDDMSNVNKALETQIKNIEAKTGKSLAELAKHILESSLTKHGELRDMVKEDYGLGYGDANTLVHLAKKMGAEDEGEKSTSDIVEGIYTGKKEALLPLHNHVMDHIEKLGEFEIAPKKSYLSLRRKKQFATVGPGSKGRVEIGLNMKGIEGTSRLEVLPAGRMCQYRIYLTETSEVNDELMGWIKEAYDSAG